MKHSKRGSSGQLIVNLLRFLVYRGLPLLTKVVKSVDDLSSPHPWSQNETTELYLRSRRRKGELLKDAPKNPGVRTLGGSIDGISGSPILRPPENIPTLDEQSFHFPQKRDIIRLIWKRRIKKLKLDRR